MKQGASHLCTSAPRSPEDRLLWPLAVQNIFTPRQDGKEQVTNGRGSVCRVGGSFEKGKWLVGGSLEGGMPDCDIKHRVSVSNIHQEREKKADSGTSG